MGDRIQQQNQLVAAALRRYTALLRDEAIDPFDVDSRPTEQQLQIIKDIANVQIRAVIAGNRSGKSAIGSREVAWMFENKHPYFERPASWHNEPLLILVISRVGEQGETQLWNRGIQQFLEPDSYKEVRVGNALSKVINKKNGNTILFLSHHNVNEAREKVQAYSAHYVWLDEMPNSASFIAELMLRIQSSGGRLLMTFTPLIKNLEVKNLIEALLYPMGKRYNLNMLDNPKHKGREAELEAQFAGLSKEERETRLRGTWYMGENTVYEFNPDFSVVDTPFDYSTLWPHIECVDPAASGKVGYVLLAERPRTGMWFIVKAKYIEGAAATTLLEQIAAESNGYNIIKLVSDPHEVWFIKEAYKQGRLYQGVYNKTNRKKELIKNFQEKLTNGQLKVFKQCKDWIQEVISCQWKENTEDTIIHASKYHLMDATQYGVDFAKFENTIPIPRHPDPVVAHDIELREKFHAKKRAEAIMIKKRNRRWK